MSTAAERAATGAERAEAYLGSAARARARAERMVHTAQVMQDRAAVARRLTEEAAARITGLRPDLPTWPPDRRGVTEPAHRGPQLRSVSPGDTP